MNLVAPSEHHLLVFWTQLLVLLAAARLLGQAMRRIGQPAVIGELGAGLLLGPSLLGQVAPGVLDWLFPADDLQSGMLFAVAWIGILLLLIETGFETDLALIARLGRAAAFVSVGSLVLPLVAGLVVGVSLPDVLRGDLGERTVFTLFIGAALSISSLAVAGKILADLGVIRRNFGQVILAAGMANDVAGWIMLGVIAGLATAGELTVGPVLVTVLGIAALFLGGLTLGQRAVDALLRALRRRQAGITGYLTAVVVVALVAGVTTQLIGAEAVLGAFVVGIVVGRSRFQQPAGRETLARVTAAVFAPVFFATAGLRVDLTLLTDGEVLRWAVIVIAVASLTKFVGAFAGSHLAGLPNRDGVLLGLGLNPRGTLEIVIATVGLSLEVFNEASYTVIMLLTILNSMAAPPLMRVVARSWHGTEEERRRLRREATMRTNLVVRNERLLFASRGSPNSIVAAQVVHLAWPEDVAATVLSVGPDPDRGGVKALVDVLGERPVLLEEVTAEAAHDAILREAHLGYGVIVVGAPDDSFGPWVLSPVVDELLASTTIPIVIVRRARNLQRRLPAAFAKALVPVSAAAASRAAQEVAFNLSAHIGTEIVLTHVIEPSSARRRGDSDTGGARPGSGGTPLPRADVAATKVLGRAEALAAELGARTRCATRTGPAAEEIVAAAAEEQVDMVVLGANLRRLEGEPFLGHRVEHVLEHCDATIVVVASPTGPHG